MIVKIFKTLLILSIINLLVLLIWAITLTLNGVYVVPIYYDRWFSGMLLSFCILGLLLIIYYIKDVCAEILNFIRR